MSDLKSAIELHQKGRLAEAEAGYRGVLAAEPDQPFALNLLGILLNATGRGAEALEYLACLFGPSVPTQRRHDGFHKGDALCRFRVPPQPIETKRTAPIMDHHDNIVGNAKGIQQAIEIALVFG